MSRDARLALDNMWAQQVTTGADRGAWPWLQFHNAPWESARAATPSSPSARSAYWQIGVPSAVDIELRVTWHVFAVFKLVAIADQPETVTLLSVTVMPDEAL